MKACTDCKRTLPLTAFGLRVGASADGRQNVCKVCNNIRAKKWWAGIRAEMFAELGTECTCCGETELSKLTMDHIRPHDIHAIDRLSMKEYRVAQKEHWPKDKYQILCRSCNGSKGRNGECLLHRR